MYEGAYLYDIYFYPKHYVYFKIDTQIKGISKKNTNGIAT